MSADGTQNGATQRFKDRITDENGDLPEEVDVFETSGGSIYHVTHDYGNAPGRVFAVSEADTEVAVRETDVEIIAIDSERTERIAFEDSLFADLVGVEI